MNCPSSREALGEVTSDEVLPGDGCVSHSEPPATALTESRTESEDQSPSTARGAVHAEAAQTSRELSDTWRDELSARLSQYRARRKVRPPRYPSLRLPFESMAFGGDKTASTVPKFEPMSAQSLALDTVPDASPVQENSVVCPSPAEEPSRGSTQSPVHSGAKIIEFPRFAWGPPPPPPPDQLAEPVVDRPRILEVPEITPLPPALGGITIEAQQRQDSEKRPGIDVPLQTSSLARRLLAGFIDALIVAVASMLFGFIFWKVAAVMPPKFQLVGLTVGIPAFFWAVYQYLLIIYSASTPGFRLAGLKLVRFDGALPRRSVRRWRVLGSYLSAASLGMGYVWVFLDEDGLCWHDRATRTHLARK